MTGYTVHTGTSKKFASGWDSVFGNQPAPKTKGQAKPAPKASSAKPAKKKAAKKSAKRKKSS